MGNQHPEAEETKERQQVDKFLMHSCLLSMCLAGLSIVSGLVWVLYCLGQAVRT